MKKQLILISLLVCPFLQASDPLLTREAKMFDLWSSPLSWIRDYLVSSSAALSSADVARQQVIASSHALGNSLEPFYGKSSSQEFDRIITEQATLTLALIDAAKKNDLHEFTAQQDALKKNAIILSSFLSKTNPYLTFVAMKTLLNDYLSALISMINNRIQSKWKEDGKQYDAARTQICILAHQVSLALANAFPEPSSKAPAKKSSTLSAGPTLARSK